MDVMVAPPSAEQVAQAKDAYRHAVEVLKADRDATELREKQGVVGKCFKYVNRPPDQAPWPVYVAAVSLDGATAQLTGWHFQQTPDGQLEVATDKDLQPGFLAEQCIEIARNEFVTAFNELLTAIARFANRMPG